MRGWERERGAEGRGEREGTGRRWGRAGNRGIVVQYVLYIVIYLLILSYTLIYLHIPSNSATYFYIPSYTSSADKLKI